MTVEQGMPGDACQLHAAHATIGREWEHARGLFLLPTHRLKLGKAICDASQTWSTHCWEGVRPHHDWQLAWLELTRGLSQGLGCMLKETDIQLQPALPLVLWLYW